VDEEEEGLDASSGAVDANDEEDDVEAEASDSHELE